MAKNERKLIIPWALAAGFALSTLCLGSCLLSEHLHDRTHGLSETAGQPVAERKSLDVSFVPGVFKGRSKIPGGHEEQTLDLRSNGTGLLNDGLRGPDYFARLHWSAYNNRINLSPPPPLPVGGTFAVEGDDLIDGRGARWIRVR